MDATLTEGRNAPPPPEPLSPAQVTQWLNFSLVELTDRRDVDIIPALQAVLEAHPEIDDDDDDTAGIYAENIRMAAALEKAAKAELAIAKTPYLEGGRAVDGWRNRFLATLAEPVSAARAILLAYENRKAARARAEAERRAQEAAERARLDAEAAAKAMRASLFDGDAELEIAAASAQQAKRAAERAQAKPAELSRTVGHYGATASITVRWDWELIDFDAVPLAYKTINETAIKETMRRRDPKTGRPTETIPGIRWIEQRSLGVR